MSIMELVPALHCALIAGAAALCLYLAAPRQRLWRAALARARFLRWLSVPLATGALAAAAEEVGIVYGLVVMLAGFVIVLLALPQVDAWMQRSRWRKA